MGMWAGISAGIDTKRQADKDAEQLALDRRRMELAEETFLENKRMSRLEVLSKYGIDSKTRDTSAKTKAAQVKRLNVIGLPIDVAKFVAASGEGAEILKQYDKVAADKRSKLWIPSLVRRVQDYLGDEANAENVASALKAGLLSGEDLTTGAGQEASLVQSIYAATDSASFAEVDEQLAQIIQNSSQGTVGAGVGVAPVGGLLGGSTRVSPANLKAIRQEILQQVGPSFGGFFEGFDPEGNPILNPSELVGDIDAVKFEELLGNAVDSVATGMQGVDATRTMSDLVAEQVEIFKSYQPDMPEGVNPVIGDERDALKAGSNLLPPGSTYEPTKETPLEKIRRERGGV